MRKTLLALIVILAIVTASVGGTLADFSDIETSHDNYIETGSLDLKVATADENWVAGDFHDDPTLDMVMEIDDGQICQTYGANLLLKNAGSGAGWAYLFFHLTEDSASIGDTTTLSIWYDTDGDLLLELIAGGTLGSLDLTPILLAELPGGEIRRLRLEIHPTTAPSQTITSFRMAFNVAFWLPQLLCYSDIENTDGYLEGVAYEGCTPGAWKNRLLDIGEWVPTGYSPDDVLKDVFTEVGCWPAYAPLKNRTLEDALGFPGGNTLREKAQILLRAAVAALLNASHPDVNYPMLEAEVIVQVNAALATQNAVTIINLATALDDANNLGSPLCD